MFMILNAFQYGYIVKKNVYVYSKIICNNDKCAAFRILYYILIIDLNEILFQINKNI